MGVCTFGASAAKSIFTVPDISSTSVGGLVFDESIQYNFSRKPRTTFLAITVAVSAALVTLTTLELIMGKSVKCVTSYSIDKEPIVHPYTVLRMLQIDDTNVRSPLTRSRRPRELHHDVHISHQSLLRNRLFFFNIPYFTRKKMGCAVMRLAAVLHVEPVPRIH